MSFRAYSSSPVIFWDPEIPGHVVTGVVAWGNAVGGVLYPVASFSTEKMKLILSAQKTNSYTYIPGMVVFSVPFVVLEHLFQAYYCSKEGGNIRMIRVPVSPLWEGWKESQEDYILMFHDIGTFENNEAGDFDYHKGRVIVILTFDCD